MAAAPLEPSGARRLQPSIWPCWLAAGVAVFAYLALPVGRSRAADERIPSLSFDPAEILGPAKRERIVIGRSDHRPVQAVWKGLEWLAEHQLPDGGWTFNHVDAPNCGGKCRDPGSMAKARNAATGLALLAFLGAGNTHKEGEFVSQVKAGRDFLIGNMKIGPHGGSFHESGGMMYSHGIAAIVLSEEDAMARDEETPPSALAQWPIHFIVYAQDPVGGGWRYNPRQPGDTSVTGWQVAALRSAQLAELEVPPDTLKKASGFLDRMQAGDGATYGYTTPGSRPATTAVGLLARLHLGWKPDRPAFQRGVEWLRQQGPSKDNMYYNYYATQVMFQAGGEAWNEWNAEIRDHLVESQVREGHEAGSWHFPSGGVGASRGGRLYSTAMALMTLEVYYCHLPIYRREHERRDLN